MPRPVLRSSLVVLAVLLTAGTALVAGRALRSSFGPAPALEWSRPPGGFPFDLTGLEVPRGDVIMAGPPKDGIPAIDEPRVRPIAAAAAAGLQDADRVVRLTIDGATRIYPMRLLRWHEIVNDTLASAAVAVVYCPLCDSVSVIDRTLGPDGGTTSFGVSGHLLDSNVLLYDRTADGLWSQVAGRAISGPQAGTSPRHLAGWSIQTLATARDEHPQATFVAFPEPTRRPYDIDPYEGEASSPHVRFAVRRFDPRLSPKAPVIGVARSAEAVAFDLERVADATERDGRFIAEVGGEQVVLEARRRRGTTVASPGPERFEHVAVVRAPEDAVVAHTWWFAWASLHPDTALVTPDR